jgi:hypothetical protein
MRNVISVWVASLVLGLLVSGCSGDDKGTAGPLAPTTSFTLSVSSSNAYAYLGKTEQMTAVASDGRVVTGGTWGSDTPSVITVDANGLVTGVSAGQANAYYVFDGRQGTKLMRGMPSVGGSFAGEYTVSTCTATEAWVSLGICGKDGFPAGTSLPYALTLAQTGDSVTGNFALGSLKFGTFSSTIDVPGTFTFSSACSCESTSILTTWNLSQKTASSMTGTLTQVWTSPNRSGSATINGTIDYVIKALAADGVVRGPSPRDEPDAVRAMRQR